MIRIIVSTLLLFAHLITYAQEFATPMSCKIKGQIISILTITERNKKSICAKYPCKAKVKILEVTSCGSSITKPLDPGNIVEITFAYTLHNTHKIFPTMKVKYPGLKKGDTFTSNTEEHKTIGSGVELVVYGYSKK